MERQVDTQPILGSPNLITSNAVAKVVASTFPISGGYIRGFITRDAGGSWISARDNVIVKTTRISGEGSDWHPIIGAKTSSGFWSFGSVGGETLCLSYDTDADYNANNNTSRVTYFPHLSGTFTVMDNSNQSGSFYATNIYAASDRRLKENIKDATINSLDIINKIKIKEYNFIADETKQKNVGVIAQELKEALPEDLVNFYIQGKETDTDHLSVNDSKLVYLLIDAIQKQQKEIVDLKERLMKMEENKCLTTMETQD